MQFAVQFLSVLQKSGKQPFLTAACRAALSAMRPLILRFDVDFVCKRSEWRLGAAIATDAA
jgi:hypothetical protein